MQMNGEINNKKKYRLASKNNKTGDISLDTLKNVNRG